MMCERNCLTSKASTKAKQHLPCSLESHSSKCCWVVTGTYCRASHTGDACRGRGRERERGISSELADMTCCEPASSLSSLLLLLLVLLLVLVLVLVRVVVVLVVVLVVVGLVVVVLVVVSVVVVVIVVIAVAAWSCGRCRCYLCSWYFFANPSKSSNRRFLQTPKKRQIGGVFAIFHILGTKNTVNTDVLAPRQRKTTVFTRF